MRKLWFLLLLFPGTMLTQHPFPAKSSGQVMQDIRHLQVTGSVLYIAAHPDDENTRLLAYLAGEKGYRTAYLALTRGDGGQNLIGSETETNLGILRTQELLAARRIDGAEQMFSRAFDFGYSKTPEETFRIWDKEMILGDVVWAIRKFKPDVIITRFPGPEKGGGGHGHHTGSAMLAKEAFFLAADSTAYPEQLAYVDTWQPKRLFWNSWRGRENEPGVFGIDVGVYNPLLGKSYGEIASDARSMHRCQAFGVAPVRGTTMEYLEFELGEPATADPFEGIDATWNRVGAPEIGKALAAIYESFNPAKPEASIDAMLAVRIQMQAKQGYWFDFRQKQLDEIILRCAGVWIEATSDRAVAAPGDSSMLNLSVLKRSNYPVTLAGVDMGMGEPTKILNQNLGLNGAPITFAEPYVFPLVPPSQPYWLVEKGTEGYSRVDDQRLIGLPQNAPVRAVEWQFVIGGQHLNFSEPVIYKYIDRSRGELYRPFASVPPITVNLTGKAFVFAGTEAKEVKVTVKSFWPEAHATIRPTAPKGWKISPEEFTVDLKGRENETTVVLSISPPKGAATGELGFELIGLEGPGNDLISRPPTVEATTMPVNGYPLPEMLRSFNTIAYEHIPTQVVMDMAEAQLVKVDLAKAGTRIGYVMGSGDEIPACLREVGYEVTELKDEEITLENLTKFDAVIAGIRAYNTRARMPFIHPILMDYVKQGGTYVVQYNTTFDLKYDQFGPYPLTLSRDRVTDEASPIKILEPESPVFTTPNKIKANDFEGWVQERGLYYPNKWDDQYQALLGMNDPAEAETDGALLVAEYGKGHYVYTGISWFRELPVGVPGAYRLFANILSLSSTKVSSGK